MSTIIKQLKSTRRSLKINQATLGTKLGLPQSHISKIESGKNDPRLSTIEDMAHLLDHELVLVSSEETEPVRLAIQYAVHHQRKNGNTSAKIFKLAEREIVPGKNPSITSKHSFKEITTRRYYPGEHKIEILAGGVSLGEKRFTLKAK